MNAALPFRNLRTVSVIDQVEQPLLTHFVDDRGNTLLQYWIDQIADEIQTLIWQVSDTGLCNYLNNSISLRELIVSREKQVVYYLTSELNLRGENIVVAISVTDIPNEYLPSSRSFYNRVSK